MGENTSQFRDGVGPWMLVITTRTRLGVPQGNLFSELHWKNCSQHIYVVLKKTCPDHPWGWHASSLSPWLPS